MIAPVYQTSTKGQRLIENVKLRLVETADASIEPVMVIHDDIRLVVRALANPWDCLDLRIDAAIVLANLLSGDTRNTIRVLEVPGVLSTLLKHADASLHPHDIAENCTIALGNIAADSDELRKILCEHGIIELMSKSVEFLVAADCEYESAIENALWVLCGVCECTYHHCIDYESTLRTTLAVMRQARSQSFKLKKRIACILSRCVSSPDKVELGIVEMITANKVHGMLINDYLASRVSKRTMLDALAVLICISNEPNPKYTALLVECRIFQVMELMFENGLPRIGNECIVLVLCLLNNVIADRDNIFFFLGTSLPHRVCSLYRSDIPDLVRNECAYCCATAIYNDTIQDIDSIYSSGMLSVLVDTIKRDAPRELKTVCLDAIDRMASQK